jgi:rare lipoprotein A (peptidoglycan hydrolase)
MTPICIPSFSQYNWHGGWAAIARRKGMPSKRGNDAMPMRRTIGISIACLVISAGAMAKAPDKTPHKSISHQSAHGDSIKSAKAVVRIGKTRPLSCEAAHQRGRTVAHHAVRGRHRYAASYSEVRESGGPPDSYLGPTRSAARMEIGKAAWYNRVGAHTSSGEVLDTVTATAAHRSLPLASYAKVTNLDSGSSVIVKINDRGPWTHRFIIDLSPRAADAIDVRRTGVAPVIVEPVVSGPTLVDYVSATVPTVETAATTQTTR